MNEHEMINGLKQKNVEALHYAIHMYSGTIKNVAKSVLSLECNTLDEVVNDVFLTLWYHISSYDETKAPFLHWLISVTKYKAIDYKRKLQARPSLELNETIVPSPVLETDDPFYTLISSLSAKDRELFIRRYLNEEDVEDIANDFGLSITSIYKRLSRGRKKIKQSINAST